MSFPGLAAASAFWCLNNEYNHALLLNPVVFEFSIPHFQLEGFGLLRMRVVGSFIMFPFPLCSLKFQSDGISREPFPPPRERQDWKIHDAHHT
jgi:hypothetical protein